MATEKKEKVKPILLNLTKDQRAWVKKQAEDQGLTMTSIIKIAINHYMGE